MLNDKQINQLFNSIDGFREEAVELLQKLIQIPSYSGEEQEIVEFIVKRMESYGFDEAFCDGLGNAVGRAGNGPVKILMDGHIDTVKVSDQEEWEYPAFSGIIKNGVIYGRGAVDEKPAMAGFLIAVKAFMSQFKSADLPFTLYVVGSVLEEDCDGYPLMHLVEKEEIRPDVVLLGEPTDLQLYRGQRGRMEIEIEIRGKAAHGAHNDQGINAIYKMMPLVRKIEELDANLPKVAPLGKGSITITDISSHGPSLCSVPDSCRIHIDRRMTVGETDKTVLAELERIMNGIKGDIRIPFYEGKSWKGTSYRQDAYFPTWMLEEDHPLVQAGMKAAGKALGRPVRTGFWGFSTNGVASAGRLDIPTIGFAPGKEELAHTTKEELRLEDLFQAIRFYALLPFLVGD